MSPKKLTEADKRDILKLYREPGETTSTLAARYDVSNSTISRLLKSRLSEDEYEVLVQQKRANRGQAAAEEAEDFVTEDVEQLELEVSTSDEEAMSIERRRRRRSSAALFAEASAAADLEMPTLPPERPKLLSANHQLEIKPAGLAASLDEEEELSHLGYEDADELDEDDEDLEDEDDEDLEDEDWDDEVESSLEESTPPIFPRKQYPIVQVLPLSEATLPKICYLVVDKSAELIVRPLREFSDLGTIPSEEVQQKTLPVFDNHRVARRFSNRTQRVIKVPDGRMLQKAGSHLQAKGITRLLIDGQVYSLS